uniref:Uncharacterized protein n=1 Tax=Seriola lalandi dorsalis TaxID=1841481 RepID=A0A3B4YQG1_SERLL
MASLFPDDQAILYQFSDLLACICIGNLIGLIGVQPNLLLATAQDAGGQLIWHLIERSHPDVQICPKNESFFNFNCCNDLFSSFLTQVDRQPQPVCRSSGLIGGGRLVTVMLMCVHYC